MFFMKDYQQHELECFNLWKTKHEKYEPLKMEDYRNYFSPLMSINGQNTPSVF